MYKFFQAGRTAVRSISTNPEIKERVAQGLLAVSWTAAGLAPIVMIDKSTTPATPKHDPVPLGIRRP